MSGPSKKSVIVTGGGSGIGLAMSRHFASEGHSVTIFDINQEAGAKIAGELSKEFPHSTVAFRKCDVSSWDDQAAAFKDVHEKCGCIDIVMANAGISEQGSTTAIDLREEEPTEPRLGAIQVNLIGVVYSKFGRPRLLEAPSTDSNPQSREARLALHEQEERHNGCLAGLDHLHGFQCRALPLPCRPLVCDEQIRCHWSCSIVGSAASATRDPNQRPSACSSR